MLIAIPPKKQAAEIHKKRTEQYHKTVSAPPLTKSSTPKTINHDPAPKPADPQDTISGTQKPVADQPTLETQSTAETHENNKTALILGSIIVGSVALIIYEIY